MMMIEQLEDLTMAINAAQVAARAYQQERNRSMIDSLELTLEPGRAYVAGKRRAKASQWCPACGYGFRMVTALTATAMADISFRTLYRWAETEEIHFSATDQGALLVCLDSLLERADAQ
jgi:fructosamine-3-kinase